LWDAGVGGAVLSGVDATGWAGRCGDAARGGVGVRGCGGDDYGGSGRRSCGWGLECPEADLIRIAGVAGAGELRIAGI